MNGITLHTDPAGGMLFLFNGHNPSLEVTLKGTPWPDARCTVTFNADHRYWSPFYHLAADELTPIAICAHNIAGFAMYSPPAMPLFAVMVLNICGMTADAVLVENANGIHIIGRNGEYKGTLPSDDEIRKMGGN